MGLVIIVAGFNLFFIDASMFLDSSRVIV
jgi:hypothetical protein